MVQAVDLYSGVGGWSLGLRLAGISCLASYDWWQPANKTNAHNNGHVVVQCDIRGLSARDLPSGFDFLVGSPPCVEFSFSNRGGSGDVDRGLQDIAAFLRMVRDCRPRLWVMENVPRVASILRRELSVGGRLYEFAGLGGDIHLVDMASYGLPQRRQRCLFGNIDFALLESYQFVTPRPTLGDVVDSLSGEEVWDVNYGLRCTRSSLTDHELELPLTWEEERINRAVKQMHRYYNIMAFPDRLDRPARTITATCTRVSRESIIVRTSSGTLRRLSLRERAVLQGFPINFQFVGSSWGDRLRMIGNALPPVMAYYIGNAMLGRSPGELLTLGEALSKIGFCPQRIESAKNPGPPARYPGNRRFAFAVPGLWFKSGVRFELCNEADSSKTLWCIRSFVRDGGVTRELDVCALERALEHVLVDHPAIAKEAAEWKSVVERFSRSLDGSRLQKRWSHSTSSGEHPLEVLDKVADFTDRFVGILKRIPPVEITRLERVIEDALRSRLPEKLRSHLLRFVAGACVAVVVNEALGDGKCKRRQESSAASQRNREEDADQGVLFAFERI